MERETRDEENPEVNKTLILTEKQIDELFEEAREQGDYIIGYYKLLYGAEAWDRIEHTDDLPHAGQTLAEYYMEKAMAWDKENIEKGFLPGGAALNYGPSIDPNLAPWEALIPSVTWKEEE